MSSTIINKTGRELALTVMRALPRVCLANLKSLEQKKSTRGRGQHGGDYHGYGNKRATFMRLGYETGNMPFYLRFGKEPYYKGHHQKRQYPPVSLLDLQRFIDLKRIDPKKPIDLTTIVNTGTYICDPVQKHYGVHLTDEGADIFQAKVNIEVQWASEQVIAAIERNGGTITTAYYDINSVFVATDPIKFFKKGEPIPRRLIPPQDCLEFYTTAANRGYLADPEKISQERLVLAQKYGYELPKIENDPDYNWLIKRKDPRQIFYDLEPGWVVSLQDQVILKPTAEYLKEYYKN